MPHSLPVKYIFISFNLTHRFPSIIYDYQTCWRGRVCVCVRSLFVYFWCEKFVLQGELA